MKRIGILTAGGDTPALNATINGAVVRANQLKIEIYGFIKGFNCFFNPRMPHVHLNPLFQSIPELDPMKGGTLIGSSRDYVDADKGDELDLHRIGVLAEAAGELLGLGQPGLCLPVTGLRLAPAVDGDSPVQNFVFGTENDVGALSPVLRIGPKCVHRLGCSHFVQESLIQFV